MKKTTVQYFCDKCGCELNAHPDRCYEAGVSKDYSGAIRHRYRVSVEYAEYMGVQFQQSMLCDKCKIEALEEVLKKLKKRSERNG